MDYSPNFIKRDPTTGLIFYDFEGHIAAQGLDLQAGSTNNPPSDRRVRWLDAGGAMVAEIYAYAPPGGDSFIVMDATHPDYGVASVTARSGPNAGMSEVVASARDGAGAGQDVRVIDDAGVSSFVANKFYGVGDTQLEVFNFGETFLNVLQGGAVAITVPNSDTLLFVHQLADDDGNHLIHIKWEGISGQLVFYVDGTEITRLP